MPESDFYDLPVLIGEQYMLSSILRETRDTIMYRAMQKELRREVIVEGLRHSAADDRHKVQSFLESAKAQAQVQAGELTRVLEVLQADGTWLVVKEGPAGDPLDMVLSNGRKISALDLCRLMMILCKICLHFDTKKVASTRFHLEDIFYHNHEFRINNPARAGSRASSSSRSFMLEAARELLPLLNCESRFSGSMKLLLNRLILNRDESSIRMALYLAEFTSLYTLMLHPEDAPAAQG